MGKYVSDVSDSIKQLPKLIFVLGYAPHGEPSGSMVLGASASTPASGSLSRTRPTSDEITSVSSYRLRELTTTPSESTVMMTNTHEMVDGRARIRRLAYL